MYICTGRFSAGLCVWLTTFISRKVPCKFRFCRFNWRFHRNRDNTMTSMLQKWGRRGQFLQLWSWTGSSWSKITGPSEWMSRKSWVCLLITAEQEAEKHTNPDRQRCRGKLTSRVLLRVEGRGGVGPKPHLHRVLRNERRKHYQFGLEWELQTRLHLHSPPQKRLKFNGSLVMCTSGSEMCPLKDNI